MLLLIVVVYALQRFSLKAAIGALILMVFALGIYMARNTLARWSRTRSTTRSPLPYPSCSRGLPCRCRPR